MERMRMTMTDGGAALRALADELSATHADPFTASFFDEHWDEIVNVLAYLTDTPLGCQISDCKPP